MAGRTKGGIYYKGSLLSVRAPPPAGAALEEHPRFDPWESIVVEWDAAGRDEEFIQVHRHTRTLDRQLSLVLSITASCRAALKGCSVGCCPGQRLGQQRGTQAVTPFEIEPDPEEEALREANARREAEAGARAARIRAKARRWARIAPATSMHGTDVT